MNVFSKITAALRGARGLEIFLCIALAAAAFMLFADSSHESGLEARLAKTLSAMDGVGDVRVMINHDEAGGVSGVLVVAEGAGDMSVYIALQEAVSGLLNIEAGRISVAQMEAD